MISMETKMGAIREMAIADCTNALPTLRTAVKVSIAGWPRKKTAFRNYSHRINANPDSGKGA